MIHDGDYVRQISTGRLFKVYFIQQDMLCATRVPDRLVARIPISDAKRVSAPSLLPGDPETTERPSQ